MNSEKLQNLILEAIDRKHISQRELAKLTGISRSTLNDIVNGKIKKIKLDDLYQISIPLELNLENLLEACGFNHVVHSLFHDRYEGMSDRQLKEKIHEYEQSELDLLDWDFQKRRAARSARANLIETIERIKRTDKLEKDYPKDKLIEDLQSVFDEIEPIRYKYDYDKLPKKG